MEFIAHRINTIKELKELPTEYGVELDLRDDLNGEIYISHNPFEAGECFEDYLKEYRHGTMILNIKSERIELEILSLLKKYNINKYFFLDCSFPMVKFLSDMNEKNIALRFSEFEGLDTILNMKGKIEWVWVDCFTKFPLDKKTYDILKRNGFKLCFVSPELQSQSEKILPYISIIKELDIQFDAICTKSYNIEKWNKIL